MKSCPRCGKEYADSEAFCEIDGTALVSSRSTGRATTVMAGESSEAGYSRAVECPVCGGKAQPGEVICNFCGTRLVADSTTSAEPPPGTRTASPAFEGVSSHQRTGPSEIGERPSAGSDEFVEERSSNRRVFGVIGFSLAAVVALAAGIGLAIYMSGNHASHPVTQASPSPSPAVAGGPSVELAKTIPIQTQGDLTGTSGRDQGMLRKVFADNKSGLKDLYGHALDSDSSLAEGMVVRLHIMPDGSVTSGAVRVSTSPNPSLDADLIKLMSTWKFAPSNGREVDIDYPLIFAKSPTDVPNIESDLQSKIANLGPGETPEYAFAPSKPSPAPTPNAGAPSPGAAAPSPEVATAAGAMPTAVSSPMATPPASHRRRAPEELASIPKPARMKKPPLTDRVTSEMHANRKLRRVQNYTNGGTVTLYGKVFDDRDKLLAERTARGVGGVTSVIDNLTTDTQEWAQNQARISRELENAGLNAVTVKVIGRDAYLDGEVKTTLDRDRAVTIAQAAAPVKVRVNLIRVAPGRVFGF